MRRGSKHIIHCLRPKATIPTRVRHRAAIFQDRAASSVVSCPRWFHIVVPSSHHSECMLLAATRCPARSRGKTITHRRRTRTTYDTPTAQTSGGGFFQKVSSEGPGGNGAPFVLQFNLRKKETSIDNGTLASSCLGLFRVGFAGLASYWIVFLVQKRLHLIVFLTSAVGVLL